MLVKISSESVTHRINDGWTGALCFVQFLYLVVLRLYEIGPMSEFHVVGEGGWGGAEKPTRPQGLLLKMFTGPQLFSQDPESKFVIHKLDLSSLWSKWPHACCHSNVCYMYNVRAIVHVHTCKLYSTVFIIMQLHVCTIQKCSTECVYVSCQYLYGGWPYPIQVKRIHVRSIPHPDLVLAVMRVAQHESTDIT